MKGVHCMLLISSTPLFLRRFEPLRTGMFREFALGVRRGVSSGIPKTRGGQKDPTFHMCDGECQAESPRQEEGKKGVCRAESLRRVEGKRSVCQAESPRREEGNGGKEERSMADRAQVSKLQWAVRGEDLSNLRNLLNSDKTLVNAVDYDQRTPLHVAALFDCRSSARVLLMQGASVNAQDRWGNSPCADALAAGNTEMVKLLKDYGGEEVGNHEGLVLAPPLPQSIDWEIIPSEIDLEHSVLIGKGSFGEIKKATWRGTPVAVKTIRPSLSRDRAVVKDFQHEVEFMVKVRHPNIVQFLGAVTLRPPLMLITEYLAGGDLHEVLKKKEALPAPRVVKYSLDIARGMSYLHSGPNVIVHRDLKPRNLIFDDAQELKVGDFGLSKLIDMKHLHDVYKMTGETGSYRYMAPEVFLHEKYDKSVDVFSFAMILYEMFEGSAPFQDEEAYEAARLVAEEHYRPEMSAKTYPPGMQELIQKCWSADRNKRPMFDTIVEELQRIEEHLPQHDWVRDLLHIHRNSQRE